MKLNKTTNSLKRIARAAVSVLISVSAVLGPLGTSFSYADQKSIGMKWTRAKSVEALRNVCSKDQQNYDSNAKNFYTPVLIIYQSGSNYYYVTNYCVNGDYEIQATRVTKVSGIKPGQDSFTTRNKCDAPSIKFTDSSNEIAIRYNDKNGNLTDRFLETNISWYGVRWHACHEASFADSGSAHGPWSSCHDDLYRPYSLYDRSDGTIRIRWMSHHSACTDRSWNWSGSTIDICNGAYESYGFMFYTGAPESFNYVDSNTVLERDEYSSAVMTDYTIASNVEIVIPKGATLIFEGQNHNCGHIYVDGGTLVIKGSLDADYNGTAGNQNGRSFYPSDIDVVNGGRLIIEREGTLIHRNVSSSVKIDKNSSVFCEGTMFIANEFYLGSNCTFRGLPGSFVAVGVRPNSDHDFEELSAEGLKKNKACYMDGILEWTNITGSAGLHIASNSSFYSDGGVFVEASAGYTIANGATFDAMLSTNKYAQVGSMMKSW